MKLDSVSIVLVRPRLPENVGAAVRAAYNFGIHSVVLVRDEMPEWARMAKTATHNCSHILNAMPRYSRLDEALRNYNLVAATTARRGKKRFAERNPKQLVEWLRPQLDNNRVAILFGAEDSGLSNEELKYAQMVSAIPTDDFSSLNLAQAVAVHCYELYQGLACGSGAEGGVEYIPQKTLATSYERESMFAVLDEALTKIDFLDDAGRPRWMANIRNFLARMEIESRDANLIRSVCKKFVEYRG